MISRGRKKKLIYSDILNCIIWTGTNISGKRSQKSGEPKHLGPFPVHYAAVLGRTNGRAQSAHLRGPDGR